MGFPKKKNSLFLNFFKAKIYKYKIQKKKKKNQNILRVSYHPNKIRGEMFFLNEKLLSEEHDGFSKKKSLFVF